MGVCCLGCPCRLLLGINGILLFVLSVLVCASVVASVVVFVVFVAVVQVSGRVGESLVGDQNESDDLANGCTDSTSVGVLF